MKKTTIIALALLAVCAAAFGQQTNTAPLFKADQKIADAVAKFSYWQGMLLPVTLVLVAAIKKWVKLIPDRYLPWTAPIIGGLLDMAAQKFGLWTGNAAVGAAMGGLATWAHQALFVQPTDVVIDDDAPPPRLPLPMWLLISALSFGVVAPVTTGCAWLQPSTVAAGHDPAVVGAEQTAKLALSYTSAFLQWEWLNRPGLPKDVTQFAEEVRDEFPKAYADFRAVTKAYKANRTPDNKAALSAAQAVIDTVIARVRLRLPDSNAKKAEAAAAKIQL